MSPDTDPDWPVRLRGVTESVVATEGPNGRWNFAALGLDASSSGDLVTARTWGRTRTRRNFAERSEGYVQFTRDPVTFVEAALTIREEADPLLDDADAWARASVERLESGESDGTDWVEWALRPQEMGVECETVPTIDRGHNAVVEATVAASRLDVPAYDRAVLLDRLAYFESVVERCGGPAERQAFALLDEQVDAEW